MGNNLLTCKLANIKNVSCFGEKDGSIKFRLYPENKIIPPGGKCFYKLVKINPKKNKVITKLTEVSSDMSNPFFVKKTGLCAGTYQINLFIKLNDEPLEQVSSCIGVITEPPRPAELNVIVHNKKKITECKMSADIIIIGGVGPYQITLNSEPIKNPNTITYYICKCNTLKVIDKNGCTIKLFI